MLLSRARRKTPASTPSPHATSASNSTLSTNTQTPNRPDNDPPQPQPQPPYPTGLKLPLLLTSLTTTLFLTALDRLVIATATPRITDAFNSAPDVGWYASSFLLTNTSFHLAFGKLYTFYTAKHIFLSSVLLFEVGSAVCGPAGGSRVFIFGPALSGVGGAGVFAGVVSLFRCFMGLAVGVEEEGET